MTCGMIIFLPFTERRGGCSSVSNSPQPLSPPPHPHGFFTSTGDFIIWLENLLSPRSSFLIPSSAGITRQGDVDGCLLPSAGELSPRTTQTMTRSFWHALLQLVSPDTSLLPPLPARAATREDAGIRCSDSPITTGFGNLSHTHTPWLRSARTHTHTSWISCCQERQRGQASCAQSRCTRQEERNEKERKKGDSKCVLFLRQQRNTHTMSKSTFLPQAQWKDYLQTAR